jgi:hypothetical protein
VSHSSQTVSQLPRAKRLGRLALALLTATALTVVGIVVTAGRSGAVPLPQWSGTALDFPSPFGASTTAYNGVSCDSPGSCNAVGVATPSLTPGSIDDYNPLVANLSSGSGWQPSEPSLGDIHLQGVSCLPDFCVAVGYTPTQTGALPVEAIYTVTDGVGNWALQASANQFGSANGELLGVSCVSTSFCVAVGDYTNGSGFTEPLMLDYNGASWTQMSFPSFESTTNYAQLNAISCADQYDCAAVGEYQDPNGFTRSMAVVLSAGTWTPEGLGNIYPAVEQFSHLDGVSCPAAGECEAVGAYMPVGGTQWLGLNGALDGVGTSQSDWDPNYTLQSPAGANYLQLSSVSCVTPVSCVAVGEVRTGTPPSLRFQLAPRSGGAPTTSGIVESITDNSATYTQPFAPGFSSDAYLTSVSCASDYSCEAVGNVNGNATWNTVGYAPPVITSPNAATFTQGAASNFTIQSSGAGPVTLSETGPLPPAYNGNSVTFADANTGAGTDTAAIAGTPGPYTGTYPIAIVATDGAGNTETQFFELTITPIGPVPVVEGLQPAQGGPGGGNTVLVVGTGLSNAIAVLFDGVPSPTIDDLSDQVVAATAPSGLFPVNVQVVGPGGASGLTSADVYSYVAPVVSSSSPPSAAGGATITLHGKYLNGVNSVTFQPGGSSSFTVNTAGTELTTTVPSLQAGPATITVTSAAGSYQFNGFSYLLPTVTGVSPASGPYGGGNEVQIQGVDLLGVYQVNFGGYIASNFSVNSTATVISAIVPNGPQGTVPVTVNSYFGSNNSFANYTINGPTLTDVAPGTAAIGSIVTIEGSSIYKATSVQFGNQQITHIFYNTPTSLTVQVPAQTGGFPNSVQVTVTNSLGTSNAVTFNYTYPPGP